MPFRSSHRSLAAALRSLSVVPVGVALCLPASPPAGAAESLGLQVPPGFEVSLYADDTLAHDIYSMTVDARGRVVVAGRGYVKILHDDDGNGRADRATLFSSIPASGAHGIVFDGADLICTGDNSVMRLRDSDGDGVADGEPEVWTRLGHSEHGANGIVRGPDGCFYVICGNNAGVSQEQITTDRSPVAHPRCGAVLRFAAAGRPLDVFAHGFRNVYDLDFNSHGRLFTVDSDGERDHHLPWYAPSRLFDIGQGLEHGWLLMDRARGWNRPPSFFDSVERLVEFGRGSPTGLVVYRHRAFPPRYRGGVFTACWSLGRVYYCPLVASGATYRSQPETFLQTTGDVGFAPCDLAVGPAGELFVAIGGRRTRGSVFCVRAVGSTATGVARADPPDVEGILSANQPLTSWSRARWLPAAEKLGAATFQQAAEESSRSIAQRVRAVEIVAELGMEMAGQTDLDWAQRMATSRHAPLRARTAWLLSRRTVSRSNAARDTQQILAQLTRDHDAAVQRTAWESLATAATIDPRIPVQPDWSTGLTSSARRVRAASILVAQRTGKASYQKFLAGADSIANEPPADRWRRKLADLWIRRPDDGEHEEPPFSADDLQTCVACFREAGKDRALALEAVRLLQVALGDLHAPAGEAEVYSGYSGRLTEKWNLDVRTALSEHLAPEFPTDNAELDRELARLLGMLAAGHDGLPRAVSAKWTDASTVEDDIHYLIIASRLPGSRSAAVTASTAGALLKLHPKLDRREQFASRNWPFRVGEAFDELCRRDPALADALVACSEFGHPHHTLFVKRLPPALRDHAIRQLWKARGATDSAPTSEMIALAGELPAEEARGMVVSQWDEAPLRDAIVLALAKHPRPEDRAKFVEALASVQAAVVQRAAGALATLGIHCSTAEMAVALRALKQACGVAKQTEPRRSLVRLLNVWTEESLGVEPDPDPARAWVAWYKRFENDYPAAAVELNRSARADASAWKKRLSDVDWARGEVTRGRVVFEQRSCHRCHEQNGHLGPALAGVTGRFSRDDLFAAIVDPNLEVSPTYQTTVIVTNSGQVYHGLIVYESPEITLLQTGPDTTMRITNTDRSSARRGTQSIMPTGLLDPLADQDLSDLYAYLRTLDAK